MRRMTRGSWILIRGYRTARHDLSVAGDYFHAGLCGGVLHRAGDAAQQRDVEPLFGNNRAAEEKRPGAADGEIIDRAGHRQPADIAADEEQRVDDIGVGRKGEPVALRHQLCERNARLIYIVTKLWARW
jgi:hypothetical protein